MQKKDRQKRVEKTKSFFSDHYRNLALSVTSSLHLCSLLAIPVQDGDQNPNMIHDSVSDLYQELYS